MCKVNVTNLWLGGDAVRSPRERNLWVNLSKKKTYLFYVMESNYTTK